MASFSTTIMPDSRPRELTNAELAAIDEVTQALAPRPVLIPPLTGSSASVAAAEESQSRPSDIFLPPEVAASETNVSRTRAVKSRG